MEDAWTETGEPQESPLTFAEGAFARGLKRGDPAEVQQRLAAVEQRPDLLALLQWASVMGAWIRVDLLSVLCDLPSASLSALLDDAVRDGLLVRAQAESGGGYHFADAQLAQALYATLDDVDIAARHRRVAAMLRERETEAEAAAALSWHSERAGDIPEAIRYAQMAGEHALHVYATQIAVRYYSKALSLLRTQLPPHPDADDLQLEYTLLDGRENAYRLLSERRAQLADLAEMARIAEAMEDVPRQIEVVTRRVTILNELGDHADAARGAETALALARQIGDRKLEADSLTALGEASYRMGEQDRPQQCHTQALQLYRELGDRAGEANSLRLLARVAYRAGRASVVAAHYEEALALYRDLRDRSGEASILNALGVVSQDYARARDYFEQSLTIAQAIGDRSGQGQAYNNLAMIYWSLGLYGRAREYLEQAVEIERDLQGRTNLAYYLESLGRVYVDLGAYEQAEQVLDEGRALAAETGARWVESAYWLGLGHVALARGQPAKALDWIQDACDRLREIGALSDLAASMAWLGKAYLALGDWDAAYHNTSEAVAHLKLAGSAGDYAPQDVWWMHYQVLKADPQHTDGALSEQARICLQRAHEAMLAGVASLSDEGLRRNYLNKVEINRNILAEWTRQSARHAQQAELDAGAVDAAIEARQLRDRLRRVLTVSQQMNEQHEAEALLEFVMDHVIELSGAERGFLVLMAPGQKLEFAATRGLGEEDLARARNQTDFAVLNEVMASQLPVLLQDVPVPDEEAEGLGARSVVCVPLLSRAALIGMIYADTHMVGGCFSQADVDLLTLFANQAATAIENARLYSETVAWAHTLEQRVTERTLELREAYDALSRRANQLETSNQVGRQLTSLLDLDELLEQVVTLIQTQFDYYFVGVWLLLENGADALVLRAGSGRAEEARTPGFRLPLDAQNPIAEAAQRGEEYLLDDVCSLPGVDEPVVSLEACAELILPLRLADEIIGVLDIQSDQPDVFGEEDRLVMQTLASQISTTIRNAQLYETELRRRRLAESLERAGRELVSSLDMQEVPGLILEQLASVVPYERCSIMLRREGYMVIVARRGFPEAQRAKDVRVLIREDDVFLQMTETHRSVLLDDVTQVPGWQFVEGLRVNRSWMGVPLITRDEVIGMISITRPEVGAFSQEDALLASAFASQAAIALQNAQLYGELTEAYQTLEKLDRTKANFIEVTAHELRTPLTVIKGYAQMLGLLPSVKQDQQAREVLEGILAGMTRMHDIVNSILDVTKIDSQVLKLSKSAVNVADLMERVAGQFEDALEERQLTLALEHLDALPPIEADPDLLFKVFTQLIVNAIKYTPDGGAITVSVQDDEAEDAVEIVVSDTGIGIDPEHHELIFEKFYQTGEVAIHSSGRTKFKGGGPGLGLAIVRGIVLAHGGRIWVESSGYDEDACPGSHFHVRLPRS